MNNNSEHQRLFGQMDDILAAAASQDVDADLADAMIDDELELNSIRLEKIVVAKLQEETPFAKFLSPLLYNRAKTETCSMAIEALNEYISTLDENDETYIQSCNRLSILYTIDDIARAMDDMPLIGKREVQINILRAGLSENEKFIFYRLSEELIHGVGIDISSPEGLQATLDELDDEHEASEASRAIRNKMTVLLDNEIAKYGVHINDPEYIHVRRNAELTLLNGLKTMDEHVEMMSDSLKILGVSNDEYKQFLVKIMDTLGIES